MERGYICSWRKIVDSCIWQDAVLFQVWHWILYRASWRTRTIMWNGEELTLLPGQLITGERQTTKMIPTCSAKKWRNSLGILTRAHRIKTKPTRRYTLITVVNYEMYQKEKAIENDEKGAPKAHRRRTEGALKATEKHLNTLKELKGQDLKNLAKNVSSSLSFTEKTKTNQSRKEKTNWKPNTKGANKMSKGDPGFEAREANRKLVKKEWAEKEKKSKKQEETKTKKK